MKIIVFSDSHGDTKAFSKALELNAQGLDLCVFLGDGTDDAEFALLAYPKVGRLIVSGNREEYLSSFMSASVPPKEVEFEAGGIKFLAIHGHRPANVKNGLDKTANYAAKKGVDVVLYGHTHIKDDRVIEADGRKIRMINPGSVGSGTDRSFALLSIENGILLCKFGNV